jgi:hypothetical protein
MSEPISTSTATAAVAGVTVLSILPLADPSIVIGAFTGATLFVMTDDILTKWRRVMLFVVSFLGGAMCAGLSASLLSQLMPGVAPVHAGVGAIVASALLVRILQAAMRLTANPESIINYLRGK